MNVWINLMNPPNKGTKDMKLHMQKCRFLISAEYHHGFAQENLPVGVSRAM